MKNLIFTISVFLFTVFLSSSSAQEKKENKFPLIQKLAWVEGTYRGEIWGGISEEIWSAPVGNNIIGTYRYMKDGEIVFTELVYITEENNTLTLKLKHFTKEFVGWEEKDKTVDFPLVEIKDNEVIFSGLTMKKTGEDTYRSTVKIKDKKTGEVKEEEFLYKKVR